MCGLGDNCVEVDMLTHPNVVGELKKICGKPIIFVTSAHFLYDDRNFFYYKTHRKMISVLQVISTLRPVVSVYYPHDLKDPIKEEEMPYLPLFDLFLSPLPNLQYLEKYLPVINVGWIKCVSGHARVMPDSFNPSRAVFFTGAYQYYLNAGMDFFYQEYKPLFDAGIAVKMPLWHDNDLFEDFLRQREVKVYPSNANSIDVMKENEVMFTQALSSVNVEASGLGKKVVYIKSDILDYKSPEKELEYFENIMYVDSPSAAAILDRGSILNNIPSISYFDFVKARESIMTCFENRMVLK